MSVIDNSNCMTQKLRTFAEHAPLDVRRNPDIYGYRVDDGNGTVFVCECCAARIMARGCRIDGGKIQWRDRCKGTVRTCCVCERKVTA